MHGLLFYGDPAKCYVFPIDSENTYFLNRHMKNLFSDIVIVPNNILIEEENISPHTSNGVQAHYRRVYEGRDATVYVQIIDHKNYPQSFD